MAAGPGNLEVTVNGGRVPTAAAAQGAHTYAISFTPRDPRPHTVELRFNGDHVPGKNIISWNLKTTSIRLAKLFLRHYTIHWNSADTGVFI